MAIVPPPGAAAISNEPPTAPSRSRMFVKPAPDVRMPGVGGIEAARLIKAERPDTCVVLVSTTYVDELPRAADASSADEIVWKGDLRPAVLEQLWLRHRP